ncbi:MAG: nuclease-related domain-containing protein [Herbaspirillum sp.]
MHEELIRLKKGIQGEKESAHYLDGYFKGGENHVVLHDLRFIVDGEVAQIDHLIINRMVGIYLLETKNYAANLVINEQGEFTAEYGNMRFGIPSPIEHSHRHERVLCKLLETLEIVGRTQKQPNFFHVVMLHPKAIITRPPTKLFDTSNVIKSDQFPTWHQSFVDKFSVGSVLKSALNLRSLDTITEWGKKLIRQHRPADLLALPDFMRPMESHKEASSGTTYSLPLSSSSPISHKQTLSIQQPSVTVVPPSETSVKRLICAHCGNKITYAEGKFCWNNSKRFGGSAYCREHQMLF